MKRGVTVENKDASKKSRLSGIKKYAPLVISALLVFYAGWAVGSGRITIRARDVSSENASLPRSLDYSSIDTIYNSIKDNFDGKLTEKDLLDGMKAGLAKATGDPYTEYFNPKDAKEFYGQLDGTFEGIGAELGKDDSGNIIVIAPIAGYPAEKAGVKPKDLIAKVDDKTTTDLSIDDTVKLIRGKAGTTVKLLLVRDGTPVELTITREAISIPSVKSEVKDGIGILTISRFGEDTVALAQKAAGDFKSQNVKGVVLDLRSDPGGLLESAVDVSSLWLQDKTVLTERRDNKIIQTYSSRGTATLNGIKTIVLINSGSASASEITAGALKDNSVATLLGEKSYGKGSVQQPIDLKDGSLLKVTVARWFTPAGKNIDKEGINPDTEVKFDEEAYRNKVDNQLEAALAQLK